MNRTRLFCLLLAFGFAPVHGAENNVALQTELKVQSVGVAVHAPLNWHYRPGQLFPLEFFVDNPGAPVQAEIELTEGGTSGSLAERTSSGPISLPSGRSRQLLSARASPLTTGLVLRIRSVTEGGGSAELFRAPLGRLLSPLPQNGRIILVCSNSGAGNLSAPHGPDDSAAQLSARDLPPEAWMWESIDWLVLGDGAIKDAPASARAALKSWLLGGGRIFLGSREALAAAHVAGLLPIPADKQIDSSVTWWDKNAGLKKANVLAAKNFRPVYARLNSGFGTIVFLFPGSEPSDADGAAVFNRPDLQRPHSLLPDARIQPARFGAFATGAPSAARGNAVLLWSALGALLLCAALFYAHSSKSRLESAILPFCAAALLAALLANGFPRPQLMASRVIFEKHSADGSVVQHEEFLLLESFRNPISAKVLGPSGGTLAPVFDDSDDLRAANFSRIIRDGSVSISEISVTPERPALFAAALASPPQQHVKSKDVDPKRTLVVSRDGTAHSSLNELPIRDAELNALLEKEFGASPVGIRAAAIKQAIDDARKENMVAVIAWREGEEKSKIPHAIEVETSHSTATDFVIQILFQPSAD